MSTAGRWLVGLLGVSAMVHGCASTRHNAAPVRSAGDQAAVAQQLPAGTTFSAVLRRGLDSQRDNFGQPFTAQATDEVRTADGTVVIPGGAILYGHIVQGRGYRGPTSVLRVDEIGTSTGRYTFHATAVPTRQRSYSPWTASRGGGPGLFTLQPAELSHWLPAGTVLRVSLAEPIGAWLPASR